jgi:hypothetical protein
MSLASALNILRPTLPYYLALTNYDLLHINNDSFEFCPHPTASRAVMVVKAAERVGMWSWKAVMGDGRQDTSPESLATSRTLGFAGPSDKQLYHRSKQTRPWRICPCLPKYPKRTFPNTRRSSRSGQM